MYECHLTINSLHLTVAEFKRIDLGADWLYSHQIFEMPSHYPFGEPVKNQWLITFKSFFLNAIINDLERLKAAIEKETLWPVVRVKIECHPDTKLHEYDIEHEEIFYKPRYYESHVDVANSKYAKFRHHTDAYAGVYESRNVISAKDAICFTIRNTDRNEVERRTHELLYSLHQNDDVILDSHIEKCILDTNQDLDKGWMT